MFNLADYETVEQRLEKYWKENPDGRIETELIEATATRFIVIARIFRTEADQRYWTSGLAFEHITERGVNSTSALENCETSAIGRALANAGYATKGKRASREEMTKVAQPNKFEQRVAEMIPVEKPSDPWTIEQKPVPVDLSAALKDLNDGIKPLEIPMCQHGAMREQQGVGKTNKPYYGFTCIMPKGQSCPPIWYERDKSGTWIPPKPAIKNEELA